MNTFRALGCVLLCLTFSPFSLAWQVGDKLEIQWGSGWYPGKVIAVEGERIKISYDGHSSSWDEWTTTARLRPLSAPATPASTAAEVPPPPPPQHPFPALPADAKTGLDGAWLRTETFMWGTSLSLTNHVWFFTANGRVSRAPSGGFDPAVFAQAASTSHPYSGTYRIEGEKIVIDWAGGAKPTTYNFARESGGGIKLGGLGCTPVRPFKTDWRVNARFEGGASTGGGVSSANSLTLAADGTFTRSSIGSVSATTRDGTVSAGSQSSHDGTYTFDGFTLRLVKNDGTTKTHTVAAFGEADAESRPEYLYLDGGMLSRK